MLREFSQVTGIRGFYYAQTTKLFHLKILWYLIIVGCIGVTIYDVSHTVSYFSSNPWGTKTVLFINSSLDLGEPTLCIPFNNSFSTSGISEKEIESFVEENGIAMINFVRNASAYNPPFSLVSHKLMSLVISIVSSASREQYQHKNDFQLFSFGWGFTKLRSFENNSILLENEKSQLVSTVADFYDQHNISISELILVAGMALCNEFKVKFHIQELEGPYQRNKMCDPNQITWVGFNPVDYYTSDIFCVKFPNSMSFHSTSDYATVSFHHPDRFSSLTDIKNEYGTLDFMGQPVVWTNAFNVFWFNLFCRTIVRVRIAAHYKIGSRASTQMCSTGLMKSMCLMECRGQYIERWCNCTPILQRPKNRLPDCSVPHFSSSTNINCQAIRSQKNPDKNCEKKCAAKCDYYLNSFFVERVTKSEQYTKTDATLWVDTFRYPEFEEISLVGPKQFFAALGGNLSLYLGASFFVLLHAILFWIEKLIELMKISLT